MCSCQGNIGGQVQQVNFTQSGTPAPSTPIDCNLTTEMLQTWKAALVCIKSESKYTQVHITEQVTNQFLGIIQSSLNYPDNYCYYDLEGFKNTILPKIANYASECLN